MNALSAVEAAQGAVADVPPLVAMSAPGLAQQGDPRGAGVSALGQRFGSRSRYALWVKPVLDRVVAGLLLAVFSPLLVVLTLVVFVSMRGNPFFRQRRVGLDGREFIVLKFRTMTHDRRRTAADFGGEDRRKTHKTPDHPLLTPTGRVLRKLSLDEMPQLLNVLAGHMSLVGPRPELPSVVERYEPWQHRRHCVRPGLTGLWQVSARGSRPMHECTDLDLAYVESISLATDVKILLRTPMVAFGKRTGY